MAKVKLGILLHDCFMEIGHTHAMLELVRNSNHELFESVEVIAYSSDTAESLLPSSPHLLKFTKVPFGWLKPALLRSAFFHLWTWIYCRLFQKRDTINVSIGAASIVADIVNIQFVHAQWNDLFFQLQKLSWPARIYKKILFNYFLIVERFLFRRRSVRFMALSKFVKDFCSLQFAIEDERIKTVYSGVNLCKFQPSSMSRIELFEYLRSKFSILNKIDITKPIFLFVGAYERKGLFEALNYLENRDDSQIIVIGKPESHRKIDFPENVNVVPIEFTNELPHFYSLADAFVFPTHYEPFGLVIIEAAAMGLPVFVTRNNVGASELLQDMEEIHFLEDRPSLDIGVLDRQQRGFLIKQRASRLQEYNWRRAGREFESIVSDIYNRQEVV